MSRDLNTGYSNYQEVIDAIKAEYVNARDLKRKATTKSRKTDTTGSFKKRKESEVNSLVDKSKSIDSLLDKTLSESVSDLNKSKFNDFKTKLAELNAKLSFIDSESKRFNLLNQIDPEKYKDATKTEEQTFSVVRNLLAKSIKDCEEAISKIYDGDSYSAIVKATKPNCKTNSDEDVINYYKSLETIYNELFKKAKYEIDLYTGELFGHVDGMKQVHSRLIRYSGELNYLKNQLTKLLQNDAPQQEIDRLEKEIELLKSKMLDYAKDLKIMESARQEWIDGKFHNVSEYIDNLTDFRDEFREFREQNDSILRREPRTEYFINFKTTELYEGLFKALIDSSGSNWNNNNEFSLVWNGLFEKREMLKWSSSDMDNNSILLYLTSDSRQMFDQEGGVITGFNKEISQEYIDFYVKCNDELQKVASRYITQHARYGAKRDIVKDNMWRLNSEISNHEKYSSNLRDLKLHQLYSQDSFKRFNSGEFDGTQEQKMVYQNSKYDNFNSEADYLYLKSLSQCTRSKFETFKIIFPDFYSNLDNVDRVYVDAKNNHIAAQEQLEVKKVETQTAYDLLQTLTVGEAEYVAALADYEAKCNNLQAVNDFLENYISADAAIAYDFLQTTLGGENAYQNTVVSTKATIDQSNSTIASELSIATATEVTKSDARATKSQAERDSAKAQSDSAQAQSIIDQTEVTRSIAQDTKSNAEATKYQAQSDKADYLATIPEGETADQTILDGYDAIIADAEATIAQAQSELNEAQATIAQAQHDLTQSNFTIANAEETIAQANDSIENAQMTIDSALKNIADAQNTIVTANEELRQVADSHYIYLGAQSDYDTKLVAQDAYITNTLSPAQTAVADSYTFFQDLTDEDAAYQNALADWTKKDTETNSFKEVVDTAEGEEIVADNSLQDLLKVSYGVVYLDTNHIDNEYEEILEFNGYALADAKNQVVNMDQAVKDAQEALEVNRNQFESAKREMNFVHSTQEEKLSSLDFQMDMEKSEDKFTSWSLILVAHTDYLSNLSNVFVDAINDVRNRPNFEEMMEEIKKFLEGSTRNGNPGKYYETSRRLSYNEFEFRDLDNGMKFYYDCARGMNLPDSIKRMANRYEDLLKDISSNDSDSFRSALLHITDRNLLRFPASYFIFQIEDLVINGNPLVRGNS